nr:MAG TPA: HicB family [Caudoviricetes sp.]
MTNLEKGRIIMVSKRKENKMIQTTIRIPVELHRKLKELAKKKGLTVNALIVQALWKL